MDDLTFTFVSAAAAFGGAMGTLVGFRRLQEKRLQEERARPLEPQETVADVAKKHRLDMTAMRYANDFSSTIGYLATYSLYGMVVYPWMPLYVLGGMIHRNSRVY